MGGAHLSVSDKIQKRVGILLSQRFEHTITDVQAKEPTRDARDQIL
jgi:hypothetical protein